MRKRNHRNFNILLWQINLFLLIIFCSCYKKKNDFDGKWKIINNGMLITSAREEKEALYSTCTGQFVEINNSKIYGHSTCAFYGGFTILEIDTLVNVALNEVILNNEERFMLTLEYLIDSSEYEDVKIYDLNVVNCPNKYFLTYKYFFKLKKDLVLVLANESYIVLKKESI